MQCRFQNINYRVNTQFVLFTGGIGNVAAPAYKHTCSVADHCKLGPEPARAGQLPQLGAGWVHL